MYEKLKSRRILVFTVDAWNSRNGVHTFSELLSDCPAEHLANVYLREELPDDPRCEKYFQISEQRVLRSLIHRSAETGRTVFPGASPTVADKQAADAHRRLYATARRSRTYPFRQLAREVVWKLGRWHTPALDKFLDDFSPDVILFDMSNYIHLTRLVRYAIRRTGAAAIGNIWDDTFTYRPFARTDAWRIHRAFNRRALKSAAGDCQEMWAITEKTAAEADAFFSTKKHPVTCRVLTKPIRFLEDEGECTPTGSNVSADSTHAPTHTYPADGTAPLRLLYTGNLLIGRFDSLVLLSNALQTLNEGAEVPEATVVADIYTATALMDAERARLSPYIRLHDPVPPAEVKRLQKDADVLLLLEALKPPYEKISRLSFSAKLTDYLHAGRCILALLPPDNATREYLTTHRAALCVSDPASLVGALRDLCTQPGLSDTFARASYDLGRKNHDKVCITRTVEVSIEAAIAKKKATLPTGSLSPKEVGSS